MLKFLMFFCLVVGGNMEYNSITETFREAYEIEVTIDNSSFTLNRGDDKYELVLNSLEKITESSHDMPAYGVSLDKETRKEKQKGTWIELKFEKPLNFRELEFESLLIEVKPEYSGFNLIRKNNNKYDGRCFYLDLKDSMKELSETIENINFTK